MKIQDVPFFTADWDSIIPTKHLGKTGNIRVRMVEYTPGYLADHWCRRGHVLLVLEGELVTELQDGRKFTLTPGTSYQVAEDVNPHRSYTEKGAKLFIVD
jgi:hypothetical protein